MEWHQAAVAPAAQWAQQTFGTCQVGDGRLTNRLVNMAAAMAACPGGSLPQQLLGWAAVKGAYRFLAHPAVTVDAVLDPHLKQTRVALTAHPVVLLVQDTTMLDFSGHRKTTGLGPIGDGRGRGFHLQTMLALEPDDGVPLGVAATELWVRTPPIPGETRAQRRTRPRESQRWGRLVRQVGTPPAETIWVHVADREADCFDFLATARAVGAAVLVRIAQNRRIHTADGDLTRLFTYLEQRPAQDHHRQALPARVRPGRADADLSISWSPVQVLPPQPARAGQHPIAAWAIRVWEPEPPPEQEPIAWNLLTTVPVVTAQDAWERVRWYTRRWVIEDFHQVLKTGCAVEASQLRTADKLQRQVALLLPVAVRLLQLRALARAHPDMPATDLLPLPIVQAIARQTQCAPAATVGELLLQIARLGGWLARRGDGPPGWRTLWHGWQRVQLWQQGLALNDPVPPLERYG